MGFYIWGTYLAESALRGRDRWTRVIVRVGLVDVLNSAVP